MPSATSVQVQAEQQKNAGNEFRKRHMYREAVEAYRSAVQLNSRYADAYYNWANLMAMLGDTRQAVGLMTQVLYINPNDHDARVTLGEYYEKLGQPQDAKRRYMEVLSVKPDFDPARRRLDYLLYQDQKRWHPDMVGPLLQVKYKEVVHKARELLKQFYATARPNPVLANLSQTIPVVFEETQTVEQSANIAEFDARRGVIRIHPMMMFSTPNVVGAYLAHELRHAVDQDSHTSVMEEQDGYRDLALFWQAYQGAENDPNLDRALELFKLSTDKLDQEVRRVYTIRDAQLPETSPGHGQIPQNQLGQAYLAAEQKQLINSSRLRPLMH